MKQGIWRIVGPVVLIDGRAVAWDRPFRRRLARPTPSPHHSRAWRPTCRRRRMSSSACSVSPVSARTTSSSTSDSGDGRLVVTAAKQFGARGIGVDIDPARIAEGRANAKQAGVESLVEFRQQDALQADISQATVVTLYLLSSSNVKLRPRLLSQLKPGARIVSHQFGMGDWTPDKVETFTDSNGTSRTLYLWTVGANSPKQ